MEQEIAGPQVGDLEPLDRAAADLAEVLLDPFGSGLLAEQREQLGAVGDQADVAGVALVAGAGVGDEIQAYLHRLLRESQPPARMAMPAAARAAAVAAAALGLVAAGE